jgi:hypothetical protein
MMKQKNHAPGAGVATGTSSTFDIEAIYTIVRMMTPWKAMLSNKLENTFGNRM